MLELGRRLRKLREEREMTQHSLAKSSLVAADMISRLENGHYQSPGLRTLLRVADGLGVRVADLLPEVVIEVGHNREAALRGRVMNMARRATVEELEMLLNLADVVLQPRSR
ncbi:MAG: helix-turn-helix transcriptional regulator [Myxococcales bacterium]|nr:helix-turn-helix transcriptional regulator [Myxococcales bacterium]MCB9704514.1 helix-turn-helix transcriptional regulator [Myxococcales bacterium]